MSRKSGRKAEKSFNFKFQVTSVTKDASGECIIEGYANTVTKDRVGDIVLSEAFAKCLPTYQKNPVILLNHDWNDVIGRSINQEITDKGLFIRARISDTRNDIKTLIREGCYSTFSIGYNEIEADYDESTKTKYIKELELLEISVVSVPANTEAMFTQITEKTETEETGKKDDEKKVKKAGALKTFISDMKKTVGAGFDDEVLFAVIDYFNSQEEPMETKELIKLLKQKTLPEAPKKEEAKADDAAAPKDQAPAGDDVLKAIAQKLDMLAEAVAQIMQGMQDEGKEDEADDSAEGDKPKDEGKADPAKEEPSKEDAEKDKDEEKKDDCAMDKEEDDKDEEKEMSLSEVDKTIADLSAQIDSLDEEING